ncbi:dr1-associated corepressor-like [Hippocampus comes]|uniref:dr1-associated corepressor-like n=1 Tax=Hippocampus comes TaxID=109280 RepID=UPI00094F1ACE|nr:PREDICTED: dr1-associated corepressor-like [Hippocampus comes]XP_019733039.1 PREDICTED: dr1-associated corepressor-like [Hippocampus comes]
MPARKRRFNVRFSPARIKKIMQKNAEVGRIAMAVPVIISRLLEMFLKSLLTKTCLITQSNLSGIMSLVHVKQCIESEKLFHFLKNTTARFTFPSAQKDNAGLSVWPAYLTKRPDGRVRRSADVGEVTLRRSPDSLGNDSSSSVNNSRSNSFIIY